jgi:hypothetical protein
MVIGALALANLSRLEVDSSYVDGVLPSLIGMGLGMGMIVSPSMSTATAGVQPYDAGVASALVNTMQQVGGGIGPSVLGTIATTATAAYAAERPSTGAQLAAQASTHGYTVAFAISAGTFAFGAVLALLMTSKARVAPSSPPGPGSS